MMVTTKQPIPPHTMEDAIFTMVRKVLLFFNIHLKTDYRLTNPSFNVFPISFLEQEGHRVGFGVLEVGKAFYGDEEGAVRILLYVEFQNLL